MIFDSAFQIEKVVSPDFTRGLLHYVYFDPSKKCLAATDGHCMAIVPATVEESDTEGPVTGEALKAARKAAGKRGTPTIALNGHQAIANGPSFPRPDMAGMSYPPIDQVIPEYRKGTEGTLTIAFSVDLLAKLAAAIGANDKTTIIEMTIKLPPTEGKDKGLVRDPLVIKSSNGADPAALGILMPCRVG
jgi:hypothetical protein